MKKEDLLKRLDLYLTHESDPAFLKEANALRDGDVDKLTEAFGSDLEFGTGGLRGIIGAGSARINLRTISLASVGVASYAKTAVSGDLSAVVSFDSRNYSKEFALKTALVFASMGVKTYLFQQVHPIAALSFTIRRLKASFGVMITASHNPPEYNGYKVFWSDGAQVLPPHDSGIIAHAARAIVPALLTEEAARAQGLLVSLDDEADRTYIDAMLPIFLRRDEPISGNFSVVYTPLFGSGKVLVEKLLKTLGYKTTIPAHQAEPNGNFPGLKTPNPEDPSALADAITLANENGADLVLGTDPDADRLGVASRTPTGFVSLTGNEVAVLLLDYVLSTRKEKGALPANGVVISTIVTTPLCEKIALSYGMRFVSVLTGFKYIADQMLRLETTGSGSFLFGCEESLGYLCEESVRDKDAISAAAMITECAAWNKTQGRTLVEKLESLYQTYGYFNESQLNFTYPGLTGLEKSAKLMSTLRTAAPTTWAGTPVSRTIDYASGETTINGKREKNIDLPSSNVIEFRLNDRGTIIARPSGTEPKVKFYVLCHGNSVAENKSFAIALADEINAFVKAI